MVRRAARKCEARPVETETKKDQDKGGRGRRKRVGGTKTASSNNLQGAVRPSGVTYMTEEQIDRRLGDAPRILRYPSKCGERRPLKVEISTWVGTSAIGASHYNVRISEGENSYYDGEENCWLQPWAGVPGDATLQLSATTYQLQAAIDLAVYYVKLAFQDLSKYEVQWDGAGCPKEWERD